MWKIYSADYLKNNRASGISVMAASFIAALFLSLLCGLFYNFWLDDIEGVKAEEGDWHGRIVAELGEEELETIRLFANVDQAIVNETLSKERRITVADVYFHDKRTIYGDMRLILNALGLPESAAAYNYQLLSLYFVRIPGDTMPRLLMPAYLAVVVLVCISLILVIHNSFAVSMNSRVHQFGIFSSIGATPGQIRAGLIQEALVLSGAPILLGLLTGTLLSFATVEAMGAFAAERAGGRNIVFQVHPAVLAVVLLLSVLTVLISAWLPAVKLSRLTPLEAIRGTGELQLKRRNRFSILPVLFGVEGELAGNALRAQKKALRTTSLSLTLGFLGFMLIQCFFTLSGISTNHTYFEAYQDMWDVMVTVKDTAVGEFDLTEAIRELPGVDGCAAYQKAEAVCVLPKEAQSGELEELGGFSIFAGENATLGEEFLLVNAPVIILDDVSFGELCEENGIAPRFDGTIILNRFWDSVHSNFRYREYVSFVRDGIEKITLRGALGLDVEIPVTACIEKPPLLREEYADYSLAQFVPQSLWKDLSERIAGTEKDMYVRVLATEREVPEMLAILEKDIRELAVGRYETESENRIQERLDNDEMIAGYETIMGAFCVLFAVIGIAHVFSHTLGFLRQRKREFARYMSVGLAPEGIRKIFCIEALVLVGCPMLTSLLVTIAAVAVMVNASHLAMAEFLSKAPLLPIALFLLAVFAFVALAYYLGARRLLNVSLAGALRNETMV